MRRQRPPAPNLPLRVGVATSADLHKIRAASLGAGHEEEGYSTQTLRPPRRILPHSPRPCLHQQSRVVEGGFAAASASHSANSDNGDGAGGLRGRSTCGSRPCCERLVQLSLIPWPPLLRRVIRLAIVEPAALIVTESLPRGLQCLKCGRRCGGSAVWVEQQALVAVRCTNLFCSGATAHAQHS
eukprot:scaffold133146_cov28-Tisochrysis_lutea.AAC.3